MSARICGSDFERLLHSGVKPEQERHWFKRSVKGVLFAFGTGLGYHLEFLKELPANSIPLIILCDGFKENLEAVKEKLNGICEIVCLSGDISAHEIAKIIEPHRNTLAKFGLQVIKHPAASRYCEDMAERCLKVCFEASPAQNSEDSNLVCLPFGGHFLQQEISNALQDLGIGVLKIPQESENPNEREEFLIKLFQEQRPKFALSVNAKGLDAEGVFAAVCRMFSVPLHIWFADDPRPIVHYLSGEQCSHMFAWTWERAYIPWLKQKGFAMSEYLPLAGDPHIFFEQEQPIVTKLSFTGSAMASPFLEEILLHIPYDKEEVLPIAENFALQILSGNCSAEQLPGDTAEEAWIASLAIHTASREKRRAWLAPLLKIGLEFAGDSKGWQELFGRDIKTSNDINYRTGLCKHYSGGLIHANITSCQMPGAVNQRVFDVPLCGRLVIGDAQSDLLDLFPKDSICAANSPEEFFDLAKFYLENTDAGKKIAAKAREHILKEHTYVHRIKKILTFYDLG